MEGFQKSAHEELQELTQKIADGAYGRDNDLDTGALVEDLQDITSEIYNYE